MLYVVVYASSIIVYVSYLCINCSEICVYLVHDIHSCINIAKIYKHGLRIY